MFEAFCKEKLAPLALRLALGFTCVYHGYVKIMAGGGTAWYPRLGTAWQLVLAWGEFAAGLAILFGFRCRVAALILLALVIGPQAWWDGWNLFHRPLSALEPTILMLLLGLTLLFQGAGELSVDARGGGKPAPAKTPRK